MVTIKDINDKSSWAEKLHSVASKYNITINAGCGECCFYITNVDDSHTEDDSVSYKYKPNEEIFTFNYIYQMENISEKDLPEILEDHSDFVEVIRVISKKENI